MEAANDRMGTDFAREHFGGCRFGDQRLTDRAVLTAAAVMRHPGGTLPAKLGGNELFGFYRLANNRKVTHARMLEGHREQTLRRINAAPGVVLLISDTTEADFSGLESARGLGPIGNGGCRGLLCHNVLAVDFENRQVLGLVNQVTHQRRRVSRNETARQKRRNPRRESRLWKRALQDVPTATEGPPRVHACDRGADAFENIEFWEQRGEKYVIRSKCNRKIVAEDGETHLLHDYARGLKRVEGRQWVRVSENQGQPARQAQVEIGFAKLTLPAPRHKRGEHGSQPVMAWVVHVREVNPPKGTTPLEWILLTNVPVNHAREAQWSVEWYRCRPIIEELHKAMKTGCGIEAVQFTTRKALEVTLALLSVVATQLLRLRDMNRDARTRDLPATEGIDPIHVEVLSLMCFKQIKPLSIHEFCMALAKLGGHPGRKSDKPPGWLVLWRGWMQLQPMVQAIEADRQKRCA